MGDWTQLCKEHQDGRTAADLDYPNNHFGAYDGHRSPAWLNGYIHRMGERGIRINTGQPKARRAKPKPDGGLFSGNPA